MKQCWLEHVELNNFKSYAGHHLLGPFKNGLNCIVGPNGSGKSNLMDAICFVLAVDTRHLRGLRLQDLAYRRENHKQSTQNINTKVSLKLRVKSEEGQQQLVTFTRRTLDAGKSTQFLVDEEVVEKETYLKKLAHYGILPRVQNCLVSQGQVEALSLKSDKEKSAIIDEVSGSSQLRPKYDALKDEIKTLRAQQARQMEEVRALQSEHRALKSQWDDLKAWYAQEEEVKKVESDLYLFRLFINEKLGSASRLRLAAIDEEMRVSELRSRELEKLQRETEMAIRQGKQSLSQIESELRMAREKESSLVQKLAGLRRQVDVLQQAMKAEEQQKQVKADRQSELYAEYEKVCGKWSKILDDKAKQKDKYQKRKAADPFLTLDEKLMKRYREEKNRIATRTAKAAENLANIQSSLTTYNSSLIQTRSQCEAIEANEVQSQRAVTESSRKLEEAREKQKEVAEVVSNYKDRICTKKEEIKSLKEKQNKLADHLEENQRVIDSFSQYKSEDYKATKFRQALVKLKEAIPGVYNRVSDICELSNQKYATAVSTALGLQADSVVVDTFATAKRAVTWGKEMRIPPIEYLPLDSIKSRQCDPRLRNYPDLFTPVTDVLTFDAKFSKIFDYILEDTVIVPDLDRARKIAFQESKRLHVSVRVVTEDGQTILKNCNMKLSAPRHQQLNRFAEKARQKAFTYIEENSSQYDKIDKALRAHETELFYLETAYAKALVDLEASDNDIHSLTNLLKTYAAAQTTSETGSKLRHRLVELETKIADLKHEEDKLKKEVENFSSQTLTAAPELEAVRRAEVKWNEIHSQYEAHLLDLKERESSCAFALRAILRELGADGVPPDIESQMLTIETKLNSDDWMTESQTAIAELARKQALLEKEESVIRLGISDTKDLTTSLKTKQDEEQAKVQAAESNFQAQMTERKGLHRQLHLLSLETKTLSEDLSVFDEKAKDLLRELCLKKIHIPVKGGTLQDIYDIAIEGRNVMSDAEIDFSSIALDRQKISENKEVEAVERALEAELREKREALQKKGSMNHKAEEAYDNVKDLLKKANEKLQEMRKLTDKKEKELVKTQDVRKEKFVKCFEKTRKSLIEIYGTLTKPPPIDFGQLKEESEATRQLLEKHFTEQTGGSANLEMDDPTSDEPFNKGVLFTAMPYGKRYTEMELLSGGEKSIATLALLFALQAYRPSPFVILDEVDAALDANNVDALRRFLQQASFQVILITLKDEMYCYADAIIGVYKDQTEESSKTVTLDTERYPISLEQECF